MGGFDAKDQGDRKCGEHIERGVSVKRQRETVGVKDVVTPIGTSMELEQRLLPPPEASEVLPQVARAQRNLGAQVELDSNLGKLSVTH